MTRDVTQADRIWCTEFDRSPGFLEGKWDDGVTMRAVVAHRLAVEADTAHRIFDEVHRDTSIDTDAAIKVYAAVKRALARDRDRSGEADETAQQAQPEARARAEGIAQTPSPPSSSRD